MNDHPENAPVRRPLSPWRCIAAAVGLLLLAGAAFFLSIALRESRAFDRARREPVAVFEADLSRPGVYKATVREWYPAAHGESLRVELGSGDPPAALSTLRGTLEIIDAEGAVRETTEVPGDPPEGPGVIQGRIACFWPPRVGEYTFRLTITHPEPALAGVPHRVVAEYDLCGCEKLVSIFGGWIGGALSFVGGLATIIVVTTGGIRHPHASLEERALSANAGTGYIRPA